MAKRKIVIEVNLIGREIDEKHEREFLQAFRNLAQQLHTALKTQEHLDTKIVVRAE